MEPLQRRSDGIYETPSGLFAVVPLHITGKLAGEGDQTTSYFRFKPTIFAEAIEIRWLTGEPFVIIEQGAATSMLRNGHATNISGELADRYNMELEEFLKKQKQPKTKEPEQASAPSFPPPPFPIAAPDGTDDNAAAKSADNASGGKKGK